jgi:hypothetical protein
VSAAVRKSKNVSGLPPSDLFAQIANFQFELPALERHEQASELFPGHFTPIDHEHRRAPVRVEVVLDAAPHKEIGDGESRPVYPQMLDRERPTHASDQSPQQDEKIGRRGVDRLELVAAWRSVDQFERMKRHPIAQQTQLEMKSMFDAGDVDKFDGLKTHVSEIKPAASRNFLIEAATAKVPVARIRGAVVDGIVARDMGVTRLAHDIAHRVPSLASMAAECFTPRRAFLQVLFWNLFVATRNRSAHFGTGRGSPKPASRLASPSM